MFHQLKILPSKSLIAIMYPLKDDLDKELLDYSSQNDCIIFIHGDRMNILITGGAGFVCSHLADKLYEKKHNLFLLDNLLTGNKSNIDHLLENENVKFIEHDVQNHIEISDDIDFIFHFASAASPIAYQENPVNTLKGRKYWYNKYPWISKSQKSRLSFSINFRNLW